MPASTTPLTADTPTAPALDLSAHTLLLLGVVGSTAYGLTNAGSNVDRLGIFLTPTRSALGLHAAKHTSVTHVTTAPRPDSAVHELGKFCSLALKANPTTLELLWLPQHEVATPAGEELIALRSAFLSEGAVRGSYGGYARQQANRALAGTPGFGDVPVARAAKHGRHCLRLLRQGQELLATGTLPLDVSSIREELFAAGDLAVSNPLAFQDLFDQELARLDTTASALPDRPDFAVVNDFVVRTRLGDLDQ